MNRSKMKSLSEMDNITFELIPAGTKFYYIVRRGEEVLFDSQTASNGKSNPGRSYSKRDAYMRAWIIKNKEEKKCQGRPKRFSHK